jgi:hypothetical protein
MGASSLEIPSLEICVDRLTAKIGDDSTADCLSGVPCTKAPVQE